MNLLSTKWMPDPPALRRAIIDGYVVASEGPEGRFYVVSARCPDRARVKRAIALRNRLELAWAGGLVYGGVLAIVWFAHWIITGGGTACP